MITLRWLINSIRIALAYWLMPPSEVDHICDPDHWARIWACPRCGRVVCHGFGGAPEMECNDCWATAQ